MKKINEEVPFTSLLIEPHAADDPIYQLKTNKWVYLEHGQLLYKMEASNPLVLNTSAIEFIDIRKPNKNNKTAELNLYLKSGSILGFYVSFERIPEFLNFLGVKLKNELSDI